MAPKNYPEPDIPVNEAWEAMKNMLAGPAANMPSPKAGKPFPFKIVLYAGAGLLLSAVLVFYSVKEKLQHTDETISYHSQNQPQKDTLFDGTIAFLDSYSSISGMAKKTGVENNLTIKGAAYFEADRSSNQQSHHLKIGSLDVMAAKANIYVSHDTAAGISAVYIQSGTAIINIRNDKRTLSAGASIVYDEKKKQVKDKQPFNINLFSYATNIFEFTNSPLKEVAETIEKAYKVQIVFENTELYSCRLTTRFDNKSLKEILEILAYTLNFEYRLNDKNNQVLLTGNGCK